MQLSGIDVLRRQYGEIDMLLMAAQVRYRRPPTLDRGWNGDQIQMRKPFHVPLRFKTNGLGRPA